MSPIRSSIGGGLLLLGIWIASPGMVAQGPPQTTVLTDISGEWVGGQGGAVMNGMEDIPSYGPGPELGDYTGMPINAAARQRADAWDATILSQPERQTAPHPMQYRNNTARRIEKVLDPVTEQLVAYTIAGFWGRPDRVIWLDGRPHPSDYSEHTWEGFATGVWKDGVLEVTTTHMKAGVIRRNGLPSSPYAKVIERYFRHGNYMTVFFWLDDPIYLEEPYVRTNSWILDLGRLTERLDPFEVTDELDKPAGWVPFFPLGTRQTEFAERFKLPFEVTRGGAQTMYPEYRARIQQLMQTQPAQQTAEGDTRGR